MHFIEKRFMFSIVTCTYMYIELSQARQDAFDLFRKNYADTTTISEHKKMLKIK
jgi:hypothetical protein